MAVWSLYDIDNEFMIHRIEEPWSLDEILAAVEGIIAHPCYRPGMVQVVDHRRVETAPTTDEIHRWINKVRECLHCVPRRRATLVARTLDFGVARVAAARLDCLGLEQRVFTDPDTAARWLFPHDAGRRASLLSALESGDFVEGCVTGSSAAP